MDFLAVEENLRESFRLLAVGRERGDVCELPGLAISSLGVRFQMFNAAFLSAPANQSEMERRLTAAQEYFSSRALPWAFWACESWLDQAARRRLSAICAGLGLRLSSEMPGMVAASLDGPMRMVPTLEYRPALSAREMADFRGIGSVCFRVPMDWFHEVFEDALPQIRPNFRCWVGYLNGLPVATAATVPSRGAIGLYNVATDPAFRGRGFGEAITRHVMAEAASQYGRRALVLQSTSNGLRLYERLGFRAVTRILVYNSVR
ncbi:MAG TPA: GNAT family N-acetyltransferase [Bryobacteraceae bacterium]|nr:GNAT family N-acetyltransferase [Bryobacteraceae bacterium]